MAMTPAHRDLTERVARAICVAKGRDPDAPRWIEYPGGVPTGICWHENIAAAEAVLAALAPELAVVEAANRLGIAGQKLREAVDALGNEGEPEG